MHRWGGGPGRGLSSPPVPEGLGLASWQSSSGGSSWTMHRWDALYCVAERPVGNILGCWPVLNLCCWMHNDVLEHSFQPQDFCSRGCQQVRAAQATVSYSSKTPQPYWVPFTTLLLLHPVPWALPAGA